VDRDKFFGINADINYLAEWLNTFVNRHNRWLSPKYLIGESYGGTRVSGLAYALQAKQWMYLNGVILVSPADYLTFESDTPLASALNFPYFASSAWYHKMLPSELQSKPLDSLLEEVENFTINSLVSELMKGGFIEEENKKTLAKKMSYYSGVGMDFILDHNLDIPKSAFWKELLRKNEGKTIGRLDSRYKGLDKRNAGSSPDYNVELTNWLHSFTPAINYYMRETLGFKTDLKYNVFGSVHPWDKKNNNTRDDLRKAMAQNPYLNVFFQVGYFDGATTYFHSKYTMWQLDPSGKMKDRMLFKGYESGHMMYLRKEDLKTANNDLREFIKNSFKEKGVAKYD
jgi:carboxypeptidase C (cathepsin A)